MFRRLVDRGFVRAHLVQFRIPWCEWLVSVLAVGFGMCLAFVFEAESEPLADESR